MKIGKIINLNNLITEEDSFELPPGYPNLKSYHLEVDNHIEYTNLVKVIQWLVSRVGVTDKKLMPKIPQTKIIERKDEI